MCARDERMIGIAQGPLYAEIQHAVAVHPERKRGRSSDRRDAGDCVQAVAARDEVVIFLTR